jgi:hypothetical protein
MTHRRTSTYFVTHGGLSMNSLEPTPAQSPPRGTLWYPLLAYLLGVATALLFLSGNGERPSLLATLGLVGLGLGAVMALWAYRTSHRGPRHSTPPQVPRVRRPRPSAVGQDLPTVTDYYENAADGVVLPQAPHRWEPLPPEPEASQPPNPVQGNRQPVMG